MTEHPEYIDLRILVRERPSEPEKVSLSLKLSSDNGLRVPQDVMGRRLERSDYCAEIFYGSEERYSFPHDFEPAYNHARTLMAFVQNTIPSLVLGRWKDFPVLGVREFDCSFDSSGAGVEFTHFDKYFSEISLKVPWKYINHTEVAKVINDKRARTRMAMASRDPYLVLTDNKDVRRFSEIDGNVIPLGYNIVDKIQEDVEFTYSKIVETLNERLSFKGSKGARLGNYEGADPYHEMGRRFWRFGELKSLKENLYEKLAENFSPEDGPNDFSAHLVNDIEDAYQRLVGLVDRKVFVGKDDKELFGHRKALVARGLLAWMTERLGETAYSVDLTPYNADASGSASLYLDAHLDRGGFEDYLNDLIWNNKLDDPGEEFLTPKTVLAKRGIVRKKRELKDETVRSLLGGNRIRLKGDDSEVYLAPVGPDIKTELEVPVIDYTGGRNPPEAYLKQALKSIVHLNGYAGAMGGFKDIEKGIGELRDRRKFKYVAGTAAPPTAVAGYQVMAPLLFGMGLGAPIFLPLFLASPAIGAAATKGMRLYKRVRDFRERRKKTPDNARKGR